MKKEFLTPSIEIKSFITENILTASGDTPGITDTNENIVTATLKGKVSEGAEEKIAKLTLTW